MDVEYQFHHNTLMMFSGMASYGIMVLSLVPHAMLPT